MPPQEIQRNSNTIGAALESVRRDVCGWFIAQADNETRAGKPILSKTRAESFGCEACDTVVRASVYTLSAEGNPEEHIFVNKHPASDFGCPALSKLVERPRADVPRTS